MPPEQKTIRKLRAILSADVKGYSLLMADNEAQTIQTLKAYRQIMFDLITQHSGRVIDSPGDNLLAEFGSAVDALECAVDIQQRLKKENEGIADDQKLQFRIGINIGDVVQDEDRIYGSGVNIAARIEGLADPGGICISRNAYDHIKDKLKLGYEYLGQHEVKNIKDPVRVYRVLSGPEDAGKLIGEEPKRAKKKWVLPVVIVAAIVVVSLVWHFYQSSIKPDIEPASVEKMAYPLPEKPSIAVLPFDNMSGDPKQDYFSDGITEQIITGLSNVPKLFVMSRSATFTYKGKPVKPKQIAEELGVQYVLEGSVQKSGNRIRITAQLIDALAGHHLWAEQYDRELKDIFSLQDEITIKIITAMRVKLTSGEQARVLEKGTKNLKAYFKYLKGREHNDRHNREDHVIARKMLEEAVAFDPGFALAQSLLGAIHMKAVFFGLSKNPKQSIAQAIKLTKKAIEIDESLARPHALLAFLYVLTRQYEKAVAKCERALELGPNDERAHFLVGQALRFAGRNAEAIPVYEKAIRLNPFPQSNSYYGLGLAYSFTGQFEKGIEACQRATNGNPNDLFAHIVLTAVYGMAGRYEEARATAEKVLKIDPKFTVKSFEKALRLKKHSDAKRFVEALRRAGLPDKPPLSLPDKPSIAVLAFDNLSGNPKQEYFSDGITEDIITALSKTPKMIVISRKSTFKYKGKSLKVQKIGQDLGARYVLEGSIRKDGERIRITAQLIDAQTGHHMWAEKYDREQKNVFALQDEITKKIITAMQVKLTEGEQARIRSKGTDNLEAYLLVIEARELLRHFNIEDNQKAKELLAKAIELDPNYAPVYRWLSSSHYIDTWIGSSKSPQKSLNKAVELSQKALSLDSSLGDAHALLGSIYVKQKKYDKSLPELEKAVELYPSGSDTLAMVANAYLYLDKIDEAILLMKKAIELNPISPGWALNALAAMYRSKGDYGEALKWSESAVKEQPRNFISHLNMCSIYSLMGREDDARQQAEEVLKLKPKFSVKKFEKGLPYKNREVKKTFIDAVLRAGLPE